MANIRRGLSEGLGAIGALLGQPGGSGPQRPSLGDLLPPGTAPLDAQPQPEPQPEPGGDILAAIMQFLQMGGGGLGGPR